MKSTDIRNTTNLKMQWLLAFVFLYFYSYSQDPVIPPGTIIAYAGTSAPPGWLLCDGSAYNTTTYSALYAAIGSTFGSNVPNLSGKFVRGANPTGETWAPTANIGATQTETMEAHNHSKGTLAATNGNQSANHTHTHTHGDIALASRNVYHDHTLSGTSGNNNQFHNHGSTNTTGSHTHTLQQYYHATYVNLATGAGTYINLWLGELSGGANLPKYPATNYNANDHSHTSGSSSRTHTHIFAGTTNSTAASHTHALNLADIESDSAGAHTHTITLSATTTSSGSGSAIVVDNISLNYIIKL